MLAALVLAGGCDEPAADGMGEGDDIVEVTIPRDDACDDVRKWPEAQREREAELMAALVAMREQGGTCPDGRRFAPAAAAQPEGALVCAARNFAAYLEQTDAFGHADGDGDTVVDRIADAGWDSLLATELVAAGDVPAARVLDEIWLPSTPHCHALRAAAWTHVGVGHIANVEPVPDVVDPEAPPTWGAYWVVVLSAHPGGS